MPFKSEKQRRYLWANEPEIARDWADTYGSRIEKNDGGIARLGYDRGGRIGFEEGGWDDRLSDAEEDFSSTDTDLLILEVAVAVKTILGKMIWVL